MVFWVSKPYIFFKRSFLFQKTIHNPKTKQQSAQIRRFCSIAGKCFENMPQYLSDSLENTVTQAKELYYKLIV